jgi:hypothetical protein
MSRLVLTSLFADPVLPAQFRRRESRFRLLQNPYYLLFRVSAVLHLKSSSSGPHGPNRRTLTSDGLNQGVQLT